MLEGFDAAKHRGTSIGHLRGQGANRVRLHHVDGFDHFGHFRILAGASAGTGGSSENLQYLVVRYLCSPTAKHNLIQNRSVANGYMLETIVIGLPRATSAEDVLALDYQLLLFLLGAPPPPGFHLTGCRCLQQCEPAPYLDIVHNALRSGLAYPSSHRNLRTNTHGTRCKTIT